MSAQRSPRRLALALGALLLLLAQAITLAQASSGDLAVIIEWPNEGETFYAGPTSLLYKIPIKGTVETETYAPEEMSVELQVFNGNALIGTLRHDLGPDGAYEFYVTVNPHGSTEQFTIGFRDCGLLCHSEGEMALQPGRLRLVVTAVAPDGKEASASRNVTVDVAQTATVPVDIVMAHNPQQSISGVNVSAATRVYLWRARFGNALTNEQGRANVPVEALTQAPTDYVLRAEPTIVDGTLYRGAESATVSLPPGAESAPPITLAVTAHRGAIQGRLSPPDRLTDSAANVWAIRLPAGAAFEAPINQEGRFRFTDLPVDDYLLTLDSPTLLQSGWQSSAQTADLTQELTQEVSLALTQLPGAPIQGQILDQEGQPLPFAWATAQDGGATATVTPGDGRFVLGGVPRQPSTILLQAPGYYAQAYVVDPQENAEPAPTLTRNPETRVVSWGQGQVVIAAESEAQVEQKAITLEQGWLWGQGRDTSPLLIHTPDATINLNHGRFALELLPERAWLYLFEGQARLSPTSGEEAITLQGNQMVNLRNEEGLAPVPYQPIVVHGLDDRQTPPLSATWEPSLSARLRDGLARLGIGAAQVVTFVTYLLVILSLLAIPLLPLYWMRRRQRAA